MIDYSVFMMKNPAKPEAPEKAYAKNQVSEIWTLEKFAKHIADHNGVYSRGTVKGVISDMCECLVEQLLNGNKIQLGELGTFGISISRILLACCQLHCQPMSQGNACHFCRSCNVVGND